MSDCVFCKIVKKEIKAERVYEDDNFIAILDANPKVKNHTLIVSKKHFRNLLDMPVSLGGELLEAIKKVSLDMIRDDRAEGVKVVINNEPSAGQVVFHAHVHILPLKEGDERHLNV